MQPGVPRILPACLSGSATSSLTLTICPAWPGSGRRPLGWKVLFERENEIVIGTGQNAPAGMCFMPVTDPKTEQTARPTVPPGRNQGLLCSQRREEPLITARRPAVLYGVAVA
jgi:hypothetical protein